MIYTMILNSAHTPQNVEIILPDYLKNTRFVVDAESLVDAREKVEVEVETILGRMNEVVEVPVDPNAEIKINPKKGDESKQKARLLVEVSVLEVHVTS